MTDHLPRLHAALADRYTIERELGRGGMATVYLAQDLKHRRRVAVKVLRPELTLALGPDRFLREIEIAAQFVHPHILPVFDSGEADGFLYYVMPYVAGESLRTRLSREGQLPVDDAVQIACEVANALAYAHAQGIVHRDIKPENILLEEGHAIVADFGIARAISAAATIADDRFTGPNLALGTPLYMSPEQAAGHLRLDGRADIYSLGCVLYEMLAGTPPFVGASPQAVAAQHAQDSPTPLGVRRPGVPQQVEEVVTKALQKLPADRFASASEFAAGLPRHRTPSGPSATTSVVPKRRSRHVSRVGWALIGALALASGLTATAFHRRATPALDASLYMVMPFRHRAESAPMLLNGDQCESLLHSALARWRGVQMVDPLWVTDARMRRGGHSSVQDGLALARERRAGRVVLGEVWQFKDTVYVRGVLYDPARSSRLLREHVIRIAPDLSDAQRRFQELADSLLIGGGAGTGAPPRAGGQFSLSAWRAFQQGYTAIQRWELDSAKAKLGKALELDPTYGMAQLWMAQVLAWSGEDEESWKRFAAGALASDDSLAPRDRTLAEGLLSLANGRHPDACERFRALIERDSLDFAAWFGLGDCQGKDPLVLRDPASPTGWSFRGSYHSAVRAYRRALQIVPSVHLAFRGESFARLPALLYTESNQIRQGYVLTAPDTLRFGAFPSMSQDTLEFFPRPIGQVVATSPEALPTTIGSAVAHNREIMREIASGWVEAFPGRADANETLALVLETLGELTSGRTPGRSALSAVRRARELAPDRSAGLRLANMETRLVLKAEQMASARRLADSLLAAHPEPSSEDARQLRGPAALTGRVHLAARLQRKAAPDYAFVTADWQEIRVPLVLTDPALALFAYASFGTPMDSLVELERRIERLIPSYIEARLRRVTREALLDMPAVLAFPERGLRPVHRPKAGGNYRLEMQWQLANGDTTRLLSSFRELDSFRRSTRPGDVAFDGTYHEARLLLSLSDTTGAIRLLDLSLSALPTLGTYVLDQVPQTATLVRGMALRAELAAQRGDTSTAREWARKVLILWADADPELQPTLARMRAIAG